MTAKEWADALVEGKLTREQQYDMVIDLERAEARIEAMKPYCQHIGTCGKLEWITEFECVETDCPCTCGLDALKEAPRA